MVIIIVVVAFSFGTDLVQYGPYDAWIRLLERLRPAFYHVPSCVLAVDHKEYTVDQRRHKHGVGHREEGRAVEDNQFGGVLELLYQLFHSEGPEVADR